MISYEESRKQQNKTKLTYTEHTLVVATGGGAGEVGEGGQKYKFPVIK